MGFKTRVRNATLAVARAVTRVLLPIGLFLVYLLGVGPTALLQALSPAGRAARRRAQNGGYWKPAEGYAPSPDDAVRQS